MKIIIKPVDEDVIHIMLEMMEEFYAIYNYPFNYEKTRMNLEVLLKNAELGRLWIFLKDNVYIGYAVLCVSFSFEYSGKTGFIDELYIRKEYRGKGIGGNAMDYILQEAKIMGIHVVHMEVEKYNEQGLKLYKKKGFNDQDRLLLSKWI